MRNIDKTAPMAVATKTMTAVQEMTRVIRPA
jgi:hypothetical protein